MITLPGVEDRTIIIGRTGSGKTYAGLWLLAQMPIDEMPWVIIDYKRDKQIAQIPYAEFVPVGFIPQHSGVYVVQPMLGDEENVEAYLQNIWDTEGIGLYIDEGVMFANSNALNTILIQGRSKQIPVIILSQRPVGISRFAFSEAQVVMVFPSTDKRDQKTIAEFSPLFSSRDSDDARIPRYHFHYYHVSERQLETLKPVPPLSEILKVYEEKLKPPAPAEQVREKFEPVKIKYVAF